MSDHIESCSARRNADAESVCHVQKPECLLPESLLKSKMYDGRFRQCSNHGDNEKHGNPVDRVAVVGTEDSIQSDFGQSPNPPSHGECDEVEQ